MNFKNELKVLTDQMFDNRLLDALLAAYRQEAEGDGYEIVEKEYCEGAETLSSVLNEEQKAALSKMENLCEENIKYGVRFGFTHGVFAGFQQFFVDETTKRPFEDIVVNEILKEPNMKKYSDYYQRRCEFNEINATLEEQLDEANREHLTSVYCGWEGRLYGVLRHAFYMGYRYALSLIEEIGPIGTTYQIIEKTLMTEHELGFTSTAEERERRQTGLSRKKIQRPQVQE